MLLTTSILGCDKPQPISRYQVPHEPQKTRATSQTNTDAPAISQRMLATILPVGNQAWFLKVMGPTSQVNQLADTFRDWQTSITFDDQGRPKWQLPNEWSQQPGGQFRYATLKTGVLDVTVSSLPIRSDRPMNEYVLSNVNRWRSQLQLPLLSPDQLSTAVAEVDIGGIPAQFIDIEGTAPAGGAGPQMEAPKPPRESSDATGKPNITYEVPAGWETGRRGSMRIASFDVQQDGEKAEVTLIALPGAAGTILQNVNRWRSQIGLDAVDESQLNDSLAPITAGRASGQLIEIIPPKSDASSPQAILAVIFSLPNQKLFVKMQGNRNLVEQQVEVFKAFVKSIRLPSNSE